MKSITIPFSFTSDTGAVATISDIDSVMKQNIMDIITTSPGERVMLFDYGANIRSLLFEEPDQLVYDEYRMDIINDLNGKLPFGKVIDVQIGVPSDSLYVESTATVISIAIKYIIPPFDTSTMTFNLNNTNITFGKA